MTDTLNDCDHTGCAGAGIPPFVVPPGAPTAYGTGPYGDTAALTERTPAIESPVALAMASACALASAKTDLLSPLDGGP